MVSTERAPERRAQILCDIAKSRGRNALYSWDFEFEEMVGKTLRYPHDAYMNALRAGVRLGLFESPVWVGVGMTPYSGSARRNRMFRLR